MMAEKKCKSCDRYKSDLVRLLGYIYAEIDYSNISGRHSEGAFEELRDKISHILGLVENVKTDSIGERTDTPKGKGDKE
jgi:hypothetical protein